jgi:hypothetical protein
MPVPVAVLGVEPMAGLPPSEPPAGEEVPEDAPVPVPPAVMPGGFGGVPGVPSEEPAEIFVSSVFCEVGVCGSFLLSAIVIS